MAEHETVSTLNSCLPSQSPPLKTVASIAGKRVPLSARTDRALIEAEADCARWARLREDA